MAGLALALAVVGSISGDAMATPAETSTGPTTEQDVDYAGLVAHVERVTAGLSGTQPVDEHSAGSSADSLVAQRAPSSSRKLDPVEADRSDAVIALLKEAVARAEAAAAPTSPMPMSKPGRTSDQVEGRGVDAGGAVVAASVQRLPAGGLAADDTIEVLKRALQARDAVIADLLRRVEQLEQRVILSDAQLDQAVGGAGPISLRRRALAGTATASAAAAPGGVAAPESTVDDEDAASPQSVQMAQAPDTEAADQAAPVQPAAPGQFEVDESLIDRALERTLVQEGVLLLPFGQAEIEPAFQYTRRENSFPVVFAGNIGESDIKRNEFETSATVRVGLPFDSQIEVGIPYNVVDESVTTTVGGTPQNNDSETGKGFGDVSVGLAKTLLREDADWWPDLIARVTWDTDTGKTQDNGVFLGSGFNDLGGSLSAVKRQDPLAFVASVSYTKTFENDDIEPGDELGFSLGTVLAASPETSLSFFFNQTFADDIKIDGDTLNGSDQTIGTFSVGAATVLGRNVLLSITGEIGLTDDAPDYAVGASLPIRFDVPAF